MKTTYLTLVRHGETEWNASKRKQGHLDSPLTAVGLAQADAIAVRLKREDFDLLYTSDLDRARITAERITALTGHEIRPDKQLRERNFGIFAGLTDEECWQKYCAQFDSFLNGGADYQIPSGESTRQFHNRVTARLNELAKQHEGAKIVVVTHGGVIDALFRFVFSVPLNAPRHVKLWNGSLNGFSYTNGAWMLDSWGDCYHLQDIGTIDDSTVAKA